MASSPLFFQKHILLSVSLVGLLNLSACTMGTHGQESSLASDTKAYIDLQWSDTPAQVRSRCEAAQKELVARLDAVALDTRKASFSETLKPIEDASSVFNNAVVPLIFYRSVGATEDLRNAAKDCSESTDKLVLQQFSRVDLYKRLKEIKAEALESLDKELLLQYLDDFEENGAALSPEKQAKLKVLDERLITLSSDFDSTLGNWDRTLDFSEEELAGLPADVLSTLAPSKVPGKKYVLTLKYPHYFPAIKYVRNGAVRKKIFEEFARRGGLENKKRLGEALNLRYEVAKLMGFKNHAQHQIFRRMAHTPEKVEKFLGDLKVRLKKQTKKDMAVLTALKRKDTGNPQATLESWDVNFYENILLESRYKINQEEIRQYFPMEHVVAEMLKVYETILSVKFHEMPKAAVWNEDVKSFRVTEGASDKAIAYFYMDLYPRDGKYGHAAAFTLIRGYEKSDGYESPVSAIVANFSKSKEGSPSLLTHDEVETLFHEFGHIMHQTLTKAGYGYFSGTNVKRDFVEAPSQMLENWVWNEDILSKISSHVQTKTPLPKELLAKMLEAKNVDKALSTMRQVFYASLDMAYHNSDGSKIGDTTAVYDKLYQDIRMLKPLRGTYPEASFGHLMGGYDAGYYGYLWSLVYAQDMFTRFEKEGLLNPKTGADYRHWILEQGGQKDPMDLIVRFLGREPSNAAFLKEIMGK